MDHSFSYSERDYIRMKVGDVLMLCLEDSSVTPIQKLVESLVVIGPDSMTVLREMLNEANKRKSQVEDDQDQVLQGLRENLNNLGLTLSSTKTPALVIRMRPNRFYELMKKQGILDEAVQIQCLQLLQDSRDLLIGLSIKLDLLSRIEEYLEDWTWGVFYLSLKKGIKNTPPLQ
jgi:hypothetical protein